MRRFISSIAAALMFGTAAVVHAQSGGPTEGAVEFLLPVGARSVGMGMATAAAAEGSESPWWNPALVARSRREGGAQVQSKVGLTDADIAAAFVLPLPPVGTIAISGRYINLGTSPAADINGNPTGTFVQTVDNVGVTLATTFSQRVAAGFTFKDLIYSYSCSGSCPQLPAHGKSFAALDFGSHAFVTRDSVIAIGVTVLNIGPKLQIQDSPQADPLPARGELGVAFSPKLPNAKDIRVITAADLVTRLGGGSSPGYRFGGELAYQNRYFARAGYVVHGPGALDGGTLGAGIVTGKLQIDFTQMMTDLGSSSDRPTLISLRYVF